MASKVSREDRTRADSKAAKPKHRPSRTPTGLPGDTPKSHRYKRRREKLGDLVDNLLVPEHKAARRLIRRSQGRNPDMAAGSNMTLYERIMAYRHLKDTGAIPESSKEGSVDEEDKKLERSDTGWGSVDISHYTNKPDSDGTRSPTPPPTLTQPAVSRRPKQGHDNNEPTTARDVHVDIDDQPTPRDRLPPVRSSTPKNPRTPSPSQDKAMSRQSSDLNKRTVLPPIHDSKQMVRVKGRSRVDDDDDDDSRERVREDTVVAVAASAARSEMRDEKRIDKEKNKEYVKREVKEEVEKIIVKDRKDDREAEYAKTVHENKEYKATEKRKQEEKIDNKNDERISDRDSKYRKDTGTDVDEETEIVKEEKHGKKESKTLQRDKSLHSRESDEDFDDKKYSSLRDVAAAQAAAVAAEVPSPVRQFVKAKSSSPNQQKSQEEPASRKAKPRASPSKQSRASPEIPEPSPWSRNKPKRKSSLEDEIERLDKMVDRDLNEIIRTLGNKSRNATDSEQDSRLKKKVMDPTFQAGIDKYLRDI